MQQRLGELFGIWLHHFPDDFTGTMRLWDRDGRLLFEHPYLKGERHGLWVQYDPAGRIRSSCTYSNDEPWDGTCNIYSQKGWLGEYRQGKPWNGKLPTAERDDDGDVIFRCYLDGKVIPEDAYRQILGIKSNAVVMGLQQGR